MGVHGEATVADPGTGRWVVRVRQQAPAQGPTAEQVTVASDDGARWTWTVGPDTTVRRSGSSGSGALVEGATAFLVEGGFGGTGPSPSGGGGTTCAWGNGSGARGEKHRLPCRPAPPTAIGYSLTPITTCA
ncbi:hypothetical protein [Streptomyces shenzhenensis]|uniref:hypothetical protein n=1 Tax=Streptomyces shenzhenensis TaxID=943815 RepID=UPI0033DA3C4D